MVKINHVEMCHICGDCEMDCKTSCEGGTCALAGSSEETPLDKEKKKDA